MSQQTHDSMIHNPQVKLEHVHRSRRGNTCHGRGHETAASRGYNAERLAGAVLDENPMFILTPAGSYYDNYAIPEAHGPGRQVESKSCVQQYPSGGYGRFRFWKRNHNKLMRVDEEWTNSHQRVVYFFVVYTIESGIPQEVGKLVALPESIDQLLDSWSLRDHKSMGLAYARDVSWRALLRRLDVSRERFKREDAIDLTT